MKPKNIKEFKALVKRYENITIEEIEDKAELLGCGFNMGDLAKELTRFGYTSSCTLCLKVKEQCNLCVYGGCMKCLDHISYDKISGSKSTEQLLKAFRARAEYLRKTYSQYLH